MGRKRKSSRPKAGSEASPKFRKKRMKLNQDNLDGVVKLFGAASEEDAINQLMDEALLRHELIESVRNIPRDGSLEDYFPGGYADEWAKASGDATAEAES